LPEVQGGTHTFLFTDIEGSTRLVKQLRSDYGEVLAEHRELLREAFRLHGGNEIDTQGDAFFVVFGRAKDAMAAAAAAQLALHAKRWPEGVEVRIRMGIHTGEAEVSDGHYHGVAVHRAARIMAAAHGGQVLLSQTTQDLVEDEEEEALGLELRDLGAQRLKDLDRPVHLYQLVIEGLPSEFPPLRTEADLGAAAEAALAPPPFYRRRTILVGVLAGMIAAAIAIPIFALAGGSGGGAALASVVDNAVGVVDAGSRNISAQAPHIQSPQGVATGAGSVWVTSGSDSLVRLSPRSHAVEQTITVGNGPLGVAVNGNDVWVANSQDRTVSRVSAQTNEEVAHYGVGNMPTGVAIGDGTVWVTNADDGTISQLNATAGKPEGTIQVGSPVHGIAYGGRKLWVTDPVGNALVEVSPTSGVVTRVNVGSGPTAVAYRNGTVWVANNLDGTVSRVDANSARVTGTFLVGAAPNGIAIAPDAVWVTDEVTGKLVRVDPSSGSTSPKTLGGRPEGVAVRDGSLWVAVQAAGAAHRGGTLRLLVDTIDFIDPARTYLTTTWQFLSIVNDGLVGFKRVGGSEGGTLVPDLAISLPRPSADGKTYTFQLRRGIRFSNGRTLRASDVRNTMERLFRAGVQQPDFYTGIVGGSACKAHPQACDLRRGIVTDDKASTVTFHLTAPDPEFLYKLALPFAYVVPTGTQSARDRPVLGTGPYRIAGYKANHLVRLVRNRYFRAWSRAAQPDGFPDEIVLRIGGQAESFARQVERGTADWGDLFPPEEIQTARTRFPAQLHLTPSPTIFILNLNTRRGPFTDVRARKALAYALDRQRAVAETGGGDFAAPSCQMLPPSFPGYRPYCPYAGRGGAPDLAKALALARQTGARGRVVRVVETRLGPFGPPSEEAERSLRLLGYHVEARRYSSLEKYIAAVNNARGVDVAVTGWTADYPAPSDFLVSLLACSKTRYVCDPALDRRMKQLSALQATDPQRADAGWAALDRAAVDRALAPGVISLKALDFVSKRVGNYQYHPEFGMLLDQVWVR
jgi:ABC-type transport system substrate-binding protein/class 3 adenylate cyclase